MKVGGKGQGDKEKRDRKTLPGEKEREIMDAERSLPLP